VRRWEVEKIRRSEKQKLRSWETGKLGRRNSEKELKAESRGQRLSIADCGLKRTEKTGYELRGARCGGDGMKNVESIKDGQVSNVELRNPICFKKLSKDRAQRLP
jgi:hypothetical protein